MWMNIWNKGKIKMDNYLEVFYLADVSDSDITEVLKEIQTEQLIELDNHLKKELKEKDFDFGDTSKEVLISMQLVSQYYRLISLIGLELLEREK